MGQEANSIVATETGEILNSKEIHVEHYRGSSSDLDTESTAAAASRPSTPSTPGSSSWANLNADALSEVFRYVPFEDRMGTLPLVCKGWRKASSHPACWRYLDMQPWFQKRADNDYLWEFEAESTVERLVMKAVDKSCGQLLELRTNHCTDRAVRYIADKCPLLTVLSIPNSAFITDESITKLAVKCPKLQELDVSDCYNISDQALEAVGRHCTSLEWLCRNMLDKKSEPFPEDPRVRKLIPGGDDEAIVVAKHMVNLKHLEMKRTSLSNRGLAHLARGCGQLESLNLACCMALSSDALARVTEKCPNIVDFIKPIAPRMYVDSERLRLLSWRVGPQTLARFQQ